MSEANAHMLRNVGWYVIGWATASIVGVMVAPAFSVEGTGIMTVVVAAAYCLGHWHGRDFNGVDP